jgi:hypothetical protein
VLYTVPSCYSPAWWCLPYSRIMCVRCSIVAVLFSMATLKFITVTAVCVRVWDALTGRVDRSYDGRRICEGAEISAACLDARGRKLIVGDSVGKTMVRVSAWVSRNVACL